MYNRNLSPMQRALAKFGVPQGAARGAMGAQAPGAMVQRRPSQSYAARQPGQPRFQQQLAVPRGADEGVLAGCGDGNCLDVPYGSPFAGLPVEPLPWMQPAALIPIRAAFPDPLDTLTLQISCGNSLFYGCCARSFNGAGEVGIISIFSGANDVDLLCPGSGSLDINYFNTNGNECCCPFDFGCFSSFFPLIMEFEAIGAPSVPPLINMVIGGSRAQGGNACAFWPGLWGLPMPGQPGSSVPVPGSSAPSGF
jgi:hypothetical protein